MERDLDTGNEGLWLKLRRAARWRELREIEQIRQFVARGPYAHRPSRSKAAMPSRLTVTEGS